MWLLALVVGCPAADETTLQPTCPGTGYVPKDGLEETDWYYRRTIVDSGSAFEGIGDLNRVQLRVEDELRVVADGERLIGWPVAREVDVSCDGGEVVVTDRVGGAYLDVRFTENRRPRALRARAGWQASFVPSSVIEDEIRIFPDYVEVTETGRLEIEPGACADFAGPFDEVEDCSVTARLRHAFSPVFGELDPIPAAAEMFSYSRTGGFVERVQGAPIYYLEAGAPEVLVEAAANVAAELSDVLGDLEVRQNDCSEQGLQRVIERRPDLADLPGDLIERCKAFEQAAPDLFTWQRPGDLRFNTIAWRSFEAPVGWGAHSARAVDPASGRLVASDLLLDGAYVESIVEQVVRHANDDDPEPEALVALALERAERLVLEQYGGPLELKADTPDRSLAAIRAVMEAIQGSGVEWLPEDRYAPALILGPNPPSDASEDLARHLELDRRIALVLELDGRATAARLMDAGYSFLERWTHPGHAEVAGRLAGLPEEEAAELVRASLATHFLLHGLLHNLGLSDNPAGSSDALHFAEGFDSSSVMDLIPAEHQMDAVTLGPYDRAALEALYRDRVPSVSYARCSVDVAMRAPTIACAADDWGASARASFAHAYGRWLGHYYFTQIIGNEAEFDVLRAVRPAVTALWRASIAAQWAFHARSNDETADVTDLLTAAAQGANFAAELHALPEPIRYCPWPGETPQVFVPWYYLGRDCDEYARLESPEAVAADQIEPPLGIARDRTFGDSAVDVVQWLRLGAMFDRSHSLWGMLLAFPTNLPDGARRIAVIDVVPEAVHTFDRLAAADDFFLEPRTARELGMGWCRDPAAPDLAYRGRAVPPRVAEVGPFPDCLQPASIYPAHSSRDVRQALFFKTALEVGSSLELYRVGVDDQDIDWSAVAPEDLCAFTSIEGVEWRALATESVVACRLLARATRAVEGYESSQDNPFYREHYEQVRDLVDAVHRLRTISL